MASPFRWISYSWFLLLTLVPLVLGAGYALLYSIGIVGLLGNGFELSAWERIFAEGDFLRSLAFSGYIGATTIIISVSAGLLLALRWDGLAGRKWQSILMYVPLTLPAIVVGFVTFQTLGKAGFWSRIFYQLGLIPSVDQFPSLINDSAGIGIMGSHIWMATPFFWILFSTIKQNSRLAEMQALGMTLGSSKRQILRRITIPILLYRALPSILLYFIFTVSSYEIPLLLGRSDPQMVSVLVIRKLQEFDLADKPEAYGMALLYMLSVLLLIVGVFRSKRIEL